MHWVTRALRRRRDQRGASAVEFALVMLPLLYLVFGIIQYGIYFWGMQSGTSAVGEAVRRISVGDCTNSDALKAFLKNRLGSATTSEATALNPTVTYTKADGSSGYEVGGTVKVQLTYPTIKLNFPFIPVPSDGNVTREYVARVEDTTASSGGCA